MGSMGFHHFRHLSASASSLEVLATTKMCAELCVGRDCVTAMRSQVFRGFAMTSPVTWQCEMVLAELCFKDSCLRNCDVKSLMRFFVHHSCGWRCCFPVCEKFDRHLCILQWEARCTYCWNLKAHHAGYGVVFQQHNTHEPGGLWQQTRIQFREPSWAHVCTLSPWMI